MPDAYPKIEGGGSLILAWQIKNKRVLVVGGGEVGLPFPYPIGLKLFLMFARRLRQVAS
jgi:siroheme synthase (precorrin-2 oxidase/ferrochelatase)